MKQLIKVLREGVIEEEPVWIEFIPEGACKVIPEKELRPGKFSHRAGRVTPWNVRNLNSNVD